MKSILIAIAVMVAGLSAGCAQMDQLAKQYNPDNAKFPGLSADPQNNQGGGEVRSGHFCYGDRRDDALWQCAGYETPAQIAQKAEQAKIAEANARIAAENQAIADAKQAAIIQIAIDKAAKLQAIEDKRQALADAKAAAFAASPAGKLKAKREAEAQAKRDAEAFNAIFGKKGVFGAAIENYNNMTPAERQRFNERNEERRYQESQQRSRESSARQQAQGDRNVFCHRNFGRSC